MDIISFPENSKTFLLQAISLLKTTFPQSYKDTAEQEIEECLQPCRVALAAVESDKLLGFVGAIPQYKQHTWELHPLVVDKDFRLQGIGRSLCIALESELVKKGCNTIYLGTDDENDGTSLSGTDLFENTFEKISCIKNIKNHPYEFYKKIGYKIVGVIPDANGIGHPDIIMAKSLVR